MKHHQPVSLDEQAGIRAAYRRVVLHDGQDDDRRSGNIQIHYLEDPKERRASWHATTEDLDVAVRPS